jgi:uncharacterized membrane protein YphA (DoxX/SURF4 family)
MDSIIWIAQLALAVIFLVSGTMKLFAFATFVHELQHRAHTSIVMSAVQGKLIGFLEVILAFGILMPDSFMPYGAVPGYLIVRFSAAGLAALMIAAGIFQTRRHESAALAISISLVALLVIVGRWPGA